VQHSSIKSRGPVSAREDMSRAYITMGRILATLSIVLLLVMPFTEHLWTFDRFLIGGSDLELGLFATISILSLVLVVSQSRRQSVASLITAVQSLVTLLRNSAQHLMPLAAAARIVLLPVESVSSITSCTWNSPLRI
jgi:hypothetical protein